MNFHPVMRLLCLSLSNSETERISSGPHSCGSPEQLRLSCAEVSSGCVFLSGSCLTCRLTQGYNRHTIKPKNTVLTDHSAGFITARFTHQTHKSLPVFPLSTTPHPPPPSFGPVSHAPYCLFNLSPSFPPSHPSVCLPCTVGQGMILHVLPRSASMKRLCSGMKERTQAKPTITEQVSLHLCRSQLTFCLRPFYLSLFFFPSSHLLFLM